VWGDDAPLLPDDMTTEKYLSPRRSASAGVGTRPRYSS